MRCNTAEVTVWVTYPGKAPDGYGANLGFQPKIEGNLPEATILALWKGKVENVGRVDGDSYDEWRTLVHGDRAEET
jgi:hypothetical protein